MNPWNHAFKSITGPAASPSALAPHLNATIFQINWSTTGSLISQLFEPAKNFKIQRSFFLRWHSRLIYGWKGNFPEDKMSATGIAPTKDSSKNHRWFSLEYPLKVTQPGYIAYMIPYIIRRTNFLSERGADQNRTPTTYEACWEYKPFADFQIEM